MSHDKTSAAASPPSDDDDLDEFLAERCLGCAAALALPPYPGQDGYEGAIGLARQRSAAIYSRSYTSALARRHGLALHVTRDFVRLVWFACRYQIVASWERVPAKTRARIRDRICGHLLTDDPATVFDPACWIARDVARTDDERLVALHYASYFLRKQRRAIHAAQAPSALR